jgi:phenylpropionate dioxygenase-like ring-hydroxylating dioxygenase large terminal subunit
MTRAALPSVGDLVEPDRVHRRVYTDPGIFALEMERIFGHAWVFVAHTSQIPNAGDYVTTRIGLQPIVVTRDHDGMVQVLYNRCTHRGSLVCLDPKGSGRRLLCQYHGWTFDMDGTLTGVPMKWGYADFDKRAEQFNLRKVARVADYRGFIFASLAESGPDLPTFLGGMSSSIDDLIDRAPDGEVTFAGGAFRQLSKSNWKLIIENSNDIVHAGALHHSANVAVTHTSTEGYDPPFGQHRVASLRANASPLSKMDESGTAAFPYGHTFIGGLPRPPRTGDVYDRYRAALVQRNGEARTDEILGVTRHLNMIYPNLLTQGFYGNIRVVMPLAVDRTEVIMYPMRLNGAPRELFETTIRMANNLGSSAGIALSDDLEMYERCQQGYAAEAVEWVDFGRGYGIDRVEENGAVNGTGTSELPMRNQFKAWSAYMAAE